MNVEVKDKILSSTLPAPEFGEAPKEAFIYILLNSIRNELSTKGDRDWLIDVDEFVSDRKRTCRLSEVEPATRRAASALRKSGIGFGDVIQIVLPCSTHYYFPVFGAWMLGGAASLSDPGLSEDILLLQLQETGGKMIFCFQDSVKKFASVTDKEIVVIPNGEKEEEEVFSNKNIISWKNFLARGCESDSEIDGCASDNFNDTVLIFWSSGTTGRPKGIEHTQRFLIHTLQKTKFESKTFLQTTCFYHTGGFFCPLDAGIYNGYKVPFLNPNRGITADAILKACHEQQPNVLMLGSHHALQIGSAPVNKDLNLGSVKILAPMGSAVHAGLIADLKHHFPNMLDAVLGFYGMSEIGSIARSFSPTSLGIVTPGVQVKIVDPLTGELQGPNQVGEILAKNATMMKGYLKRDEENKKFFTEDGFARTGDLGYYDENGVLFYHDRLKELIKYNNIHVYPNIIEEVFYQHDDVIEAGVFGLPDPKVQELVTAVVVKREGSSLKEEELIGFVNDRLNDEYKKIRGGLKFVDSIPRNPQGKILKAQLRALFSN